MTYPADLITFPATKNQTVSNLGGENETGKLRGRPIQWYADINVNKLRSTLPLPHDMIKLIVMHLPWPPKFALTCKDNFNATLYFKFNTFQLNLCNMLEMIKRICNKANLVDPLITQAKKITMPNDLSLLGFESQLEDCEFSFVKTCNEKNIDLGKICAPSSTLYDWPALYQWVKPNQYIHISDSLINTIEPVGINRLKALLKEMDPRNLTCFFTLLVDNIYNETSMGKAPNLNDQMMKDSVFASLLANVISDKNFVLLIKILKSLGPIMMSHPYFNALDGIPLCLYILCHNDLIPLVYRSNNEDLTQASLHNPTWSGLFKYFKENKDKIDPIARDFIEAAIVCQIFTAPENQIKIRLKNTKFKDLRFESAEVKNGLIHFLLYRIIFKQIAAKSQSLSDNGKERKDEMIQLWLECAFDLIGNVECDIEREELLKEEIDSAELCRENEQMIVDTLSEPLKSAWIKAKKEMDEDREMSIDTDEFVEEADGMDESSD